MCRGRAMCAWLLASRWGVSQVATVTRTSRTRRNCATRVALRAGRAARGARRIGYLPVTAPPSLRTADSEPQKRKTPQG